MQRLMIFYIVYGVSYKLSEVIERFIWSQTKYKFRINFKHELKLYWYTYKKFMESLLYITIYREM